MQDKVSLAVAGTLSCHKQAGVSPGRGESRQLFLFKRRPDVAENMADSLQFDN
jgi:hypothetical protein